MMLQKRGMMGGNTGPDYGGCTVLDVSIPSGGFNFVINRASPNSVVIDWGDGTSDTLRSHFYQEGDYQIRIGKECTLFYLAWGASTSQQYVTAIRNIGVNITSTQKQQFGWNSELVNCRYFGSVDTAEMSTSASNMTDGMPSLQEISLPENFCKNVTVANGMLIGGKNAFLNKKIKIPRGVCENALNIENFVVGSAEEIVFGEGFGTHATNIYGAFNSYIFVNNTKRLEFPSGFGACATSDKCQFLITANDSWRQSALTDLVMHGENNGIRYSIKLNYYQAINAASVVSLMKSLQPITDGMETQTLTLYDGKRSEYEASALFIDEATRFVNKGWQIAYA